MHANESPPPREGLHLDQIEVPVAEARRNHSPRGGMWRVQN